MSIWLYKSKEALIKLIEKKAKLYQSLEEYIEDLSFETEVRIENLSQAFSVFFLVLKSIFIVFIAVRCLPKGKRLKLRSQKLDLPKNQGDQWLPDSKSLWLAGEPTCEY